jgi:hypothetical protein
MTSSFSRWDIFLSSHSCHIADFFFAYLMDQRRITGRKGHRALAAFFLLVLCSLTRRSTFVVMPV